MADDKETLFAYAIQQITGFNHGRDGYDFASLLSSMGLNEDEWERLKKEESSLLNAEQIAEGDAHFKGDDEGA